MLSVLGIDIGSVAVSLVLLNEKMKILKTAYDFHKGTISEKLLEMLKEFDLSDLAGISVTSSTPSIIKYSFPYDCQLSIINAVKHFHSDVGSILFIGAENFGLISFNEKGEYKSYRSNSSCAAGTGSFLDQQATRLNLKNSSALSDAANRNNGQFPPIATRCAVFAKTDLIHAMQEGHSVGEISDGLCEGLVKNVIDTVLPDEAKISTPLIFSGGVSLNEAVVKHLSEKLKVKPIIDEYSFLYGAIGAALLYLEERKLKPIEFKDVQSLLKEEDNEKVYGYKPLELNLTNYPDFSSLDKFNYKSTSEFCNVEVDIYEDMICDMSVYLGIDIGSTSTKSVLLDHENRIIAGFYTRTSGQPIRAVQALFEAISHIAKKKRVNLNFLGVGTTGSGRKFIGKIINADLMVDEITAHARAAYELNKDVDTIIEIGGQDSKFTTMKGGMVTSSVMNNVCAAGTGSFIEEQALKLGCPIEDVAQKAIGAPAPLSSDRCTVFMERDINHYLVNGYSTEEVLASVCHSIRENYLMKVAVEANIGETICFQGATAKNKALIAAFEQKLQKPIFVSKYCHLTGALGSALILSENKILKSDFRGLNLYKENIPYESEVCQLCHNKCKITKITVCNEIVAFGFLCGRDYNTNRYIKNKDERFDLIDERTKVLGNKTKKGYSDGITVGIPSALYLAEEGVLWEKFFNSIGIKIVTSAGCKDPVKIGKSICGAEFCAPVYSFFGHVKYLTQKADYLFLPIYLENREKQKDKLRQYCYYSQHVSSLAASIKSFNLRDRLIMPEIDTRFFKITTDLFRMLNPITKCSYWSIYFAYQSALEYYREFKEKLKNVYLREFENTSDIRILLLGRPYTVLDRSMNKGIPDIISEMGLKVFYQDMISYSKDNVKKLDELLSAFHWNYASIIIEAAYIAAKTKNLYPVFITSFKCGPDSFVSEYFKRIMERYQKPYLILQLDEHESAVGYGTRIEAAIRSFRNHSSHKLEKRINTNVLPIIPKVLRKLDGKTLLFPSWDPLSSKLLEAILISEGIDARLVPLTNKAIHLGPRTNTGMCLPVNIIAQSYIEYIEENCLDPKQIVVWMFEALIACNIKMYPYFIKSVFESYGKGLEDVSVYIGKITFQDISIQATIDAYFAHVFGGMLRKVGCKIRPYEKEKGYTDKVISQSLSIFHNMFLGNRNKEDDVIKVVNLFKGIKTVTECRPKVAILGDIYVRDNDIMNQGLIHDIEENGGEVITTPFSDIAKIMANPYIRRSMRLGSFKDAIATKAMVTLVNSLEKTFYKHFNEILKEPENEVEINYKKIYDTFNLKLGQHGESTDNLLAIFSLIKRYPDLSLFIQANPAFCCAGIITDAMISQIEEVTNIPIVSINYDGTSSNQNAKIIPYIKFSSRD